VTTGVFGRDGECVGLERRFPWKSKRTQLVTGPRTRVVLTIAGRSWLSSAQPALDALSDLRIDDDGHRLTSDTVAGCISSLLCSHGPCVP
jgi:DNA-binding transcriptional LysR family regulator